MARNFPFTIRQVAEVLKLKVRYESQTNGNMDTDCPFCKKAGKLNLNAAHNIYRCNYCDEKGGMVQLYGKAHGISNSEAYREICELLGCNKANPAYGNDSDIERPDRTDIARADNDAIHQTYSMLISLLSLAKPHREQLLDKGLSHEWIDRYGYRSVPAFGQQGLCVKLLQSGCILEGVPGFYRDKSEWNVKLRAPGIVIPTWGIDGKVSGIQIRLNKPVNGRKYIWLSSPNLDGGASSGSPIHFIGDPAAKRVYITDGALKGTVVHNLTGYTFACLPGVKSLSELDDLLLCLKTNGTTEVLEAFNISKLNDRQLGGSAAKLREKISSYGLKVSSAVWGDTSLLGIDDYFQSRAMAANRHTYVVKNSAAVPL